MSHEKMVEISACKLLKLKDTHPRNFSSIFREQFDHVAAYTPVGRMPDMIYFIEGHSAEPS